MSRAPADIPIELWRRPAVTAAALACYVLAWNIPVPGLDLAKLAPLHSAGLDTTKLLSIAALGVTPLFTALVLAELLEVMVPRLRAGDAEPWRETQGASACYARASVAGSMAPAMRGASRGLEDLVRRAGTHLPHRHDGDGGGGDRVRRLARRPDDPSRAWAAASGCCSPRPRSVTCAGHRTQTRMLLETGELAGTRSPLDAALIVAAAAAWCSSGTGSGRARLRRQSTLWPMVLAFFVFHRSPFSC